MESTSLFQIRPLTDPGEMDACARRMSAADPWLTLGLGIDECRRAFEGPCKESFAAMSNGHLEGFIIMQTCGTFRGYIQTVFVSRESRGRGIGSRLLAFAEQRIFQYTPHMFICVSDFNRDARKLYERFGFTLVGELRDFIRKGYAELLLWKSSGPITEFSSQQSS